jgi:hypothetical protein
VWEWFRHVLAVYSSLVVSFSHPFLLHCSSLIRRPDRCLLRSNQCFDDLSLIHRPVPRCYLGNADRNIQDWRRVESTGQHVFYENLNRTFPPL